MDLDQLINKGIWFGICYWLAKMWQDKTREYEGEVSKN